MLSATSILSASGNSAAGQVFARLRTASTLVVLDHGRAGNAFLMRLFDQHPEVLVIPQVGYLPFHLTRMFGKRKTVSGSEAFDFLMNLSDFRYVANDLTPEIEQEYARQGDDPSVPLDRPLTRVVLEELCAGSVLTKADMIAAMHAAYAIGTGRAVSKVRYLLLNDSPLHYRSHLRRSIVEAYGPELSEFGFIHLVRDPRATFASLRHQLVKQCNGMYPFTAKSVLAALQSVFLGRAGWCVFTHILGYTSAGSRELAQWRKSGACKMYLLRNEDLNLRFLETMRSLANFLGIKWDEAWSKSDYVPTSGGRPWKGIGAYNDSYQAITHEKGRRGSKGRPQEGYRFNLGRLLANDPEEISRSSAGPNRHVTERWRSRLTCHEIALVETVYLEEMMEMGYQPLLVHHAGLSRLRGLMEGLYPMSGELFSRSWVKRRFRSGFVPLVRLILELAALPIFFICSRLALARLYYTGQLASR